ncbi:MAG TPA: OmpA family protein [Pyrinomonadaceae bacterium]|nr:OmpA family protein [Pyrinomonadaceae bacterium]
MNHAKFKKSQLSAMAFALALTGMAQVFAQDNTNNTTNSSSTETKQTTTQSTNTTADTARTTSAGTTAATGQKVKIKGIITKREADTFTLQDENGVSTVVRLTDTTSVKTKGGFFRSGKNYGATQLLRGLNVEIEGRGDGSEVAATKIRFSDTDLNTARSLQTRVDPVETRVGTAENRISQSEQNAQRLSGQIDELAAVSNAARGGAKAAQDTADQAVAGVSATNQRISALDDYDAKQSGTINFKVGSAVLSDEAKTKLDELAKEALASKGYVVEVSGFASAEGGADLNRRLSQRRADGVIRYLVENHNIPLRRIITPFGYGAAQPVADNATREGREQNRRVEVKVLVNKGLLQEASNVNSAVSNTTSAAPAAQTQTQQAVPAAGTPQ